MAIATVAVCVEKKGRGPIFVRQLRVGQDARLFYLIKFATGKQIGPLDGDRQFTKVGKMLRKTGIEYFPMLVNILKGDMSFVGPYPELLTDVARMARFVEGYDELFAVKPGITGYAQIHNPYGCRHDDINQKHDHDVAYIRHYGLRMYFRILFHTFSTLLKTVYD